MDVLKNFEIETAEHRLTVFRDDGLYRHLRCRSPKTWAYGYDLVTWPGYLAITGDAGDYVFARTEDMFQFFRERRFNPRYCAEKLINEDMRLGTRVFSRHAFARALADWWRNHPDKSLELAVALWEQCLSRADELHTTTDALEMIYDFDFGGIQILDAFEWDLNNWDNRFIWCCWAIVLGIGQYDYLKGY